MTTRLDLERYTSVHAVKRRIEEYKDSLGAPEPFDFVEEGEKIEKRWREICTALELPFRVSVMECEGKRHSFFAVVISQYALFEGVSTAVKDGKYRQEYCEIQMRTMPQRTYIWDDENKKGGWVVFSELTVDKYYTRVPLGPELLGIKRRRMRFAPVIFVSASDGQVDQIEDKIRAGLEREVPDSENMKMVHSIYDAYLSEEIMAINRLLTSEIARLIKEIANIDFLAEEKAKKIAAQLLEDALVSGDMSKKGLGGMLVNMFSKSAIRYLFYILGMIMLVYIVNLALSYYWGWPMMFPGGEMGGTPTPPGTGTPVTEMP